MVRETVAIETLAKAATVRMSGLLETVARLPFRLTNSCYCLFEVAPINLEPLSRQPHQYPHRLEKRPSSLTINEEAACCRRR